MTIDGSIRFKAAIIGVEGVGHILPLCLITMSHGQRER